MSRQITMIACSLLLAWTAHPAAIVGAQEVGAPEGASQDSDQSATNTARDGAFEEGMENSPDGSAQEPEEIRAARPSSRMDAQRVRQQQQANRSEFDRRERDAREGGQFEREYDQSFDARFDQNFDGRGDQRFELEAEQDLDQGFERPPRERFNPRFSQQFNAEARSRARMQGSTSAQVGEGREIGLGAEFSPSEDALTVSNIQEGTLAAEIGLRENDEIVSVGGRTVASVDQLNEVLARGPALQERIPIVVRRGNRPMTLYLQPQMPRDPFVVPARRVDPGLGFVAAPIRGNRLIVQEVAGGMADVIGLRENDVIVSVAGRPVATQEQFADILYSVDADQIPIMIIREGRRDMLYVRQDQVSFRMPIAPEPIAPDTYVAENAWLGVVLDTRYPDAAVVRSVVPGSPADRAGVGPGDRIERVNGRSITSPDHLTWLIDSLQPGQEVELDVSRRISGTLVARLEGERDALPRRQAMRPQYQATRPQYDVYAPGDRPVLQRQYYRGEVIDAYDTDPNRPGAVDRWGPAERGLRDRLDWDQRADEPRGLFRRR